MRPRTYKVTAHLTEPVIDADRHPIMLDSILAHARALDGDLPPLTRDRDPEIPLPLDTWETPDGDWAWCASAATYEPAGYTTVNIRRKPNTEAMARYSPVKKHHLALGPHKARDQVLEGVIIHTMTWHIRTSTPDQVRELLDRVHGIGRHATYGYGTVSRWDITPTRDPNDTAWQARPTQRRHRPPYWHPINHTKKGGHQ